MSDENHFYSYPIMDRLLNDNFRATTKPFAAAFVESIGYFTGNLFSQSEVLNAYKV